ncbi:MAG: hypothetical protein IPN47_10510 [Gemmatimonadetes bacterium]|nr:hypothetical protein [Gemmatimonadota bacterium]
MPSTAPPDPAARRSSVWHRPVSYRAQCWVAWLGLTAFGLRGVIAVRQGEAPDVERVVAVVLSVAGIDLRGRRSSDKSHLRYHRTAGPVPGTWS